METKQRTTKNRNHAEAVCARTGVGTCRVARAVSGVPWRGHLRGVTLGRRGSDVGRGEVFWLVRRGFGALTSNEVWECGLDFV